MNGRAITPEQKRAVIDTVGEQDIAQTNFYARLEEGDYCNRPNCDDCAEARKEAANG